MGPADAELIARVLERDDRHAFATLVRRHQSAVRTLLRRLSAGDEAFADDLAQETFLRAYRGLAGYRGGAKLSSWLYRIAYNVYQSRRPPQVEVALELTAEPADEGPTSDALLQRRLEGAMRVLSPPERAALTLAVRDEASHAEIAEILDCPVGTVKAHLVRGKEKLRRKLGALDPRRTA